MKDLDSVDTWRAVVDARILVSRNYDAFGCLFGMTNHAHFRPVAAKRGLPEDASARVRDDAAESVKVTDGFVMPTWVTWAELERVDWDEQALHADGCLHRYVKDERGEWVYESKSAWNAEFDAAIGYGGDPAEVPSAPDARWPEGREWQVGDKLFRAVRIRRREALDEEWWSLFAIMRELAKHFTPEGVRLVVWFHY
ncbi:MAG: hypothetical protein HY329_26120 [Chloroflexi bacterium]|nr:hypothetical protein [Chloroflexota bacterium]